MPKKLTTEIFIQRATDKHGKGTFDYSKVVYINTHTKVEIICHKHQSYWQLPIDHLLTTGCPQCGWDTTGRKKAISKEDFIANAKMIHGEDKHDYSQVKYINNNTKVKIYCNEHDILYEQIPKDHLRGMTGCNHCKPNRGWTLEQWIQFCNKLNCEYPSLYIVNFKNDEEQFIKIGITTQKVRRRMDTVPYNCVIINAIIGKPKSIYNLEKKMKKSFKRFKHKPEKKFSGYTECFSTEILKDSNFQMFLQK